MKQFLLFQAIAMLTLTCTPSIKENDVSRVQASFTDSLFLHIGQQSFRQSDLSSDYDTVTKQYRLITLSADHRKLLTDSLFGASPYSAYYYSRHSLVGTVLPVSVLSEVTDGSPLDLFLVSADGAVTATLRLAESTCDTHEAAGGQYYCDERFSVFPDDSTIQVTGVTHITEASGKTSSLDSAVSVLRITHAGKFKVLTTDTLRSRKR